MNCWRLTHRSAIGGLLIALGATADARTWTDINGRRIEADFVRVLGDKVVLDWNGRPLQIPIATLSEADQQFLREQFKGKRGAEAEDPLEKEGASPAATPKAAPQAPAAADSDPFAKDDSPAVKNFRREWTDVKGRKLVGRFVEVDGDKIVIDRDGKQVKVPYKTLSAVDQRFVHRLLKELGQPDTLPKLAATEPAEKDATTGDSVREPREPPKAAVAAAKPKRPKPKAERDLDADGEQNGKVQPLLARTWTATNGKKLRARLMSVEGTKIILSFRNKPVDIQYSDLSLDDQTYIRDRLTERGQTSYLAALEGRPAPVAAAPPPPAFVNAAPLPPPPMRGGGGGASIFDDINRRREEDRRQQMARDEEARQRQQQWAEQERQRQAQLAQQQEQERIRQAQASAASAPMSSSPLNYGADYYQCENCKRQMSSVPKDYKCPGCGTVFDYVVNPDGTRKATGAGGSSTGMNVFRAIKGGIALVLLIGGAIAALMRKISGD